MDHRGSGDESRKQGGRSVLAGATERMRKRRYRYQPFGIRNKKNKLSLDGNTERERLGG